MLTVCSKIVVPIDGSELSLKAVETAIMFAKQDEKIELEVITVVDIPPTVYYGAHAYNVAPIREASITTAKNSLEKIEERLSTLPNQTKTVLLEGKAAPSIVDFVKNQNADLVVMGSRGLSGIEEMFLGSVSHYVLQKSPCPVYIVK